MAHPAYLRAKAVELRTQRKLTIDEIAERLSLSRTTVYYWVRNIEIPRKPGRGFNLDARAKGTLAMQAKFRRIRESADQEGVESYPKLRDDRGFRDFVCLYIAEGTKRGRNAVAICNSDSAVLRLALTWMRWLCANPLTFTIQYHADQDLAELRSFWGRELGIDPECIRVQRKSNSGQLKGRSWRSAHGVLTIVSADTCARARLQAWIDQIRDEWLRSLPSGV